VALLLSNSFIHIDILFLSTDHQGAHPSPSDPVQSTDSFTTFTDDGASDDELAFEWTYEQSHDFTRWNAYSTANRPANEPTYLPDAGSIYSNSCS
jgi:hypothetical protein